MPGPKNTSGLILNDLFRLLDLTETSAPSIAPNQVAVLRRPAIWKVNLGRLTISVNLRCRGSFVDVGHQQANNLGDISSSSRPALNEVNRHPRSYDNLIICVDIGEGHALWCCGQDAEAMTFPGSHSHSCARMNPVCLILLTLCCMLCDLTGGGAKSPLKHESVAGQRFIFLVKHGFSVCLHARVFFDWKEGGATYFPCVAPLLSFVCCCQSRMGTCAS